MAETRQKLYGTRQRVLQADKIRPNPSAVTESVISGKHSSLTAEREPCCEAMRWQRGAEKELGTGTLKKWNGTK